MTADHIGYIWLGLRDNISCLEIEHQYEKLAFSPDYLIAIDIEMVLNQEIHTTIMPRVEAQLGKNSPILELNDTRI